MTINEIVAEINRILETSENQYTLWELKNLVSEKIKDFYFTDANGVYIYTNRGDSRIPLIRFKAKRKKTKIESHTWRNRTYTKMIVTSISLDTSEVGEMTVEQLVSLHKQQTEEQRNADSAKERSEYLQIKSVLDATGLDIKQLWNVSQILSKRYYEWDKLVEEWSGEHQ